MTLTKRSLSSPLAGSLRLVWLVSASLFFCGCFLIKGVDVEEQDPPNTLADMSSADQGHMDMTADMSMCSPSTPARLCQIARRTAPRFCGDGMVEDPCTGEQEAVTCTCSASEQCIDNACVVCTPPDREAVCAIAQRCDMIMAKGSCDRDVVIDCSVCVTEGFECSEGVCQQPEVGPCESVGAECGQVQVNNAPVHCGYCEENEICSGEECVKDLPQCPTMNMCGSATQVCACGGLESCLLGNCGLREIDAGAHIETDSSFGESIALYDDLMVVGASRADVEGKADAGAAFVFRRDQRVGEWRLVQRIDPPEPEAMAHFGSAVATSGRFIAIGARGQDGADMSNHGRVDVYEMSEDGASWSWLQSIAPDDSAVAANEARFGRPILFREGQLFISAPRSSVGGQVEVFELEAGLWVRKQTIDSDTTMNPEVGHFGASLDVRGDLMLVGAPTRTLASPGRAYIFRRAAGMWSLEQELLVDSSVSLADGDEFGADVLLLGGGPVPYIPVVNAPERATVNAASGELFFFTRTPMGGWENRHGTVETAGKGIKALAGRSGVLLASNEEHDGDAGIVYRFDVSVSQNTVSVTSSASSPYTTSAAQHTGGAFGRALAMWGPVAASSAIYQDIDNVITVGAVYFFDLE